MNVEVFEGGFDKNLCYLIWCDKTKIAAVIDPSVEINPIIEFISNKKLILSKILITHTHHDHIAYIDDFINLYNNLTILCFNKSQNTNFNFIGLSHNEVITIGNEILIAIYTPGHFIDSMCFWNKNKSFLFTGDTIFVGRSGRTVSKFSCIKDLYDSIYNQILILPKHTLLYPGHHYGYTKSISIKDNIITSDFFTCKSFNEFSEVMKKFEKNRLK